MPRLKDRDHFVPEGFQFLIPETGMKKPIVGSFNSVVNEVIKIRKANPYLAERYGWSTDVRTVENEVDAYNTARCQAHGWTQWIVEDNTWIEPPPYPPDQKKTRGWWGNVAVGAERVAAGVNLLIEWIGSGGKPVEPELSEKRSVVCAACPKNDIKRSFQSYFTAPLAEKIRVQLEIKNDLRLKTLQDEKLGICTGCDCVLRLKVHTPLEHILKHTSDDTKKRLDPRCWILSEAKAT